MTKQATQIRPLSDDFAVSSQIDAMDFAVLRARGIRTVINNRPDEEAGGTHMQSSVAEELARAHGIDYVYMPVTGLDVTEADAVEAFRTALETSSGPVLAHCAAGMRSAILWGLSQKHALGADEVIARAATAGYDLDIVRSELDDLAA